jgi:hypothetical protein
VLGWSALYEFFSNKKFLAKKQKSSAMSFSSLQEGLVPKETNNFGRIMKGKALFSHFSLSDFTQGYFCLEESLTNWILTILSSKLSESTNFKLGETNFLLNNLKLYKNIIFTKHFYFVNCHVLILNGICFNCQIKKFENVVFIIN